MFFTSIWKVRLLIQDPILFLVHLALIYMNRYFSVYFPLNFFFNLLFNFLIILLAAILADLNWSVDLHYFLLWNLHNARKLDHRQSAPRYLCALLSFLALFVVKLGPCDQFWWVSCEKQEIVFSSQGSVSLPSSYFLLVTTSGAMCSRECHYQIEANPYGPQCILCT